MTGLGHKAPPVTRTRAVPPISITTETLMIFIDTPPAPSSQHLEQSGPAHPLPDDRTGRFTLTIGN